MADDTLQRQHDAEEHLKSYNAIMKATGEIGLPFCIGLGALFTNLVMRNGVPMAFVAFFVTYVFVWFVVKTFFSGH